MCKDNNFSIQYVQFVHIFPYLILIVLENFSPLSSSFYKIKTFILFNALFILCHKLLLKSTSFEPKDPVCILSYSFFFVVFRNTENN